MLKILQNDKYKQVAKSILVGLYIIRFVVTVFLSISSGVKHFCKGADKIIEGLILTCEVIVGEEEEEEEEEEEDEDVEIERIKR